MLEQYELTDKNKIYDFIKDDFVMKRILKEAPKEINKYFNCVEKIKLKLIQQFYCHKCKHEENKLFVYIFLSSQKYSPLEATRYYDEFKKEYATPCHIQANGQIVFHAEFCE